MNSPDETLHIFDNRIPHIDSKPVKSGINFTSFIKLMENGL